MKKLVIFLLMMVIIPVNAYAISGTMSISCTPTEAKPGDTVICDVNGSSPSPGVITIDSTVVLSPGLSFTTLDDDGEQVEMKYRNSWIGEKKDILDGKLGGYREDAIFDNFKFATFALKLSDDATGDLKVTITDIDFCYDANYSECANIEDATTTIKVASKTPEVSPKINNITVLSGGIMSPGFVESGDNAIWLDTAETTKFKLKVDVDEGLSLSAKITGTSTTIDLNNDIAYVANGDTSMSITITVTNGKDNKDYVLLVYRPKPSAVGDAVLETLTVGGYNVNLKSGQYNYSVTLSSSVITNGYVILAKLADEDNFKFDNYSKSYINKTIYGDSQVQLTIVPMKEGVGYGSNTYIINIVKEGGNAPSSTTPETPKSSNRNVPNNPSTGRTSGIVMGIVLIVSFFASIYYYRKNMSKYN